MTTSGAHAIIVDFSVYEYTVRSIFSGGESSARDGLRVVAMRVVAMRGVSVSLSPPRTTVVEPRLIVNLSRQGKREMARGQVCSLL